MAKKQKTKVISFKNVKQFLAYLEKLKYLPLDYNRPINKKHAKDLAEAVEKDGLLRAIIVIETSCFIPNKPTLYIGDGQHLCYALLNYVDPKKIHGLVNVVVKYIDKQNEVVPLIARLNSTASNWNLLRYLNSWCAHGFEEYIYLREIKRKTKFGLSPLVECFLGGVRPKGNKDFKLGKLKLKRKIGHEILNDYDNLVAIGIRRGAKSFDAYVRMRTDNKDITVVDFGHIVEGNVMFEQDLTREFYLEYFRDGINLIRSKRTGNEIKIKRKPSLARKMKELESTLKN